MYGISAIGLYRQMVVTPGCEDWTEAQCQDAIDRWFGVYPGVKEYMAEQASFAIRHGYVCDFVGRRRIVPGAMLKDDRLKAEAIRQACNAPIQSGAQEIMKMSMAAIQPLYEDFRSRGYYIAPLCQVHDELVSEMDEDIAPVVIPLQQQIMENIVDTPMGLKTDAEWSDKTWGDLVKWVA